MSSGYAKLISDALRIPAKRDLVALDLFAGCGGLSLGFAARGFKTIGFEKDRDACSTYASNLGDECREQLLTPETEYPRADVVIGGPPCQPFSVGGSQLGLKDSRDGFPAFLAAIRKVSPKLWLMENVRGLLYRNRWYLDELIGEVQRLGYLVEFRLLNARMYDVPQNRERVIVVGHRGGFRWPEPSRSVWTAGEAVQATATAVPPESRFLTASMDDYVARYEAASACVTPRDLHLDRPARTLTCRNISAATGDMQRILLPDGRRRMLLLREAAALQSFPETFSFSGSTETSKFNQIGNAVPPMLAWHIAGSVAEYLRALDASPKRTGRMVAVAQRQEDLFPEEARG